MEVSTQQAPTRKQNLWSDVEKQAWQLPEELSVSGWADKYRVLDPMVSAEPGQWITDRTPYLRAVMDSMIEQDVEEITLMFSTQTGKTEAELNMIGYCIDQDPGPLMYVSARQEDAESVCTSRVHSMLTLSERLELQLTGKDDDIKKNELTTRRMIAYFTGSNSPASLASKPIRYLILDEVDKYPKFSGNEADPIRLARERTGTFWNRRIIKSSTPTTRQGYIFREYQQSDKRRFFVPCPHCGEYQVFVFGQIKWPQEIREPERIRAERLAWYECVACKGQITDNDKSRMLLKGEWIPEGKTIQKDGTVIGEAPKTKKRGYWLNAIYSPWRSFSDVAGEFLDCDGRPELLMNFVNSWLAEVWEEKTEETNEKKVLALQTDYAPLELPDQAVVLTAGIDTQKDYFIYVIRAWGLYEESWLVRAMRVETWEELITDIFLTEYLGRDGFKAHVRLATIDSGYRTEEVYEVCRKWKERARAIKGDDSVSGVPYKVSKIDRSPKGKVYEGGLLLWRLDVSLFKDKIMRLVSASVDDRSKWHIFKNPPEAYVNQFCSEHKIVMRDRKKGRVWEEWQKKSHGIQNHYWDAEVYATAAADMLRVSALRKEDFASIRNPGVTGVRLPDRAHENGWVRPTKGWMQR